MRRSLLTFAAAMLLCGSLAAAQNPPGLSFAALLNNVHLVSDKAIFSLGNQMQATFLEPGTEGWVILSKSGEDRIRWTFKTEEIKTPYTRLDFITITDLKTKATIYEIALKEPGDYLLTFHTDKGPFYRFPFSIEKIASPDPFMGGDLWFMNGEWNSWGYFYYYNADPGQSLYWKMWMRHQDHSVLRKDAKFIAEVVRAKDKKVICTSRSEIQWSFGREWNRVEMEMVYPTEKGYGEYFKTKDLLASDGAHFVRVTLDGKIYGIYDFTIAGGKMQAAGRTVRGTADPLTFVEGGRDAFWYRKK
jgi:hypothetical protein